MPSDARSRARRPVALAALAGCLAGCGGEDAQDRPPAPGPPVRLVLDLERPAAGAPDGGTRAGHRGGGYAVTVEGPTLAVRGRVVPADAQVSLAGARGAVEARGDGGFVVRLTDLPAKAKLALTARAPGRPAAREEVEVLRRVAPDAPDAPG